MTVFNNFRDTATVISKVARRVTMVSSCILGAAIVGNGIGLLSATNSEGAAVEVDNAQSQHIRYLENSLHTPNLNNPTVGGAMADITIGYFTWDKERMRLGTQELNKSFQPK